MDRFETIKKELIELYEKGAVLEGEVSHAQNTLEWLVKLTSNPPEHLKIATFAHDIDRVVQPRELQKVGESYDDYKKRHSERGAMLIEKFALKHGYDPEEAKEIAELVRLHVVGGNHEADILQDADSISYFDHNLERYFKRKGYKDTAAKVKWMFERCSKRAQDIIRELPMYKKFSKE